jgi:sporulation protein YlmC with PRC-barrel domain
MEVDDVAEDRMDLVYRVLDDQLVDVDGRRCGRVDDLEIDGEVGGPAYVSSILSGSGTWPQRMPRRLRRLGMRIFGKAVVGRNLMRVPWSQVEDIDTAITLRAPARELGLAQGDDHLAPLIERLPKS